MGVRKTTDFWKKQHGAWLVLLLFVVSLLQHLSQEQQLLHNLEIKEQINNAVTIDPNTVAPNFELLSRQQMLWLKKKRRQKLLLRLNKM